MTEEKNRKLYGIGSLGDARWQWIEALPDYDLQETLIGIIVRLGSPRMADVDPEIAEQAIEEAEELFAELKSGEVGGASAMLNAQGTLRDLHTILDVARDGALRRYTKILTELFRVRTHGSLSQDEESHVAHVLCDLDEKLTATEQAEVEEVIENFKRVLQVGSGRADVEAAREWLRQLRIEEG